MNGTKFYNSRGWRVLGILLILLLTVAVVTLAVMSLRPTRHSVQSAGETPGFDSSEQSSNNTAQSDLPQSGKPVPSPAPPAFAVADAGRVLAALSSDSLARAATGPCPVTPAVVETSSDAGQTWAAADLSSETPLVSITRLAGGQGGSIVALGVNPSDCKGMTSATGYIGSTEWSDFDGSGFWHVNAGDRTQVVESGGASGSPGCEVARLSVGSDDSLAALCRDGELKTSSDSAATWTAIGNPFVGSDSLASDAAGDLFVVSVGVEGCDGVKISHVKNGSLEVGGTCVPAPGVSGGQTAISVAPDGTVWLWAGDVLVRSADSGATWN